MLRSAAVSASTALLLVASSVGCGPPRHTSAFSLAETPVVRGERPDPLPTPIPEPPPTARPHPSFAALETGVGTLLQRSGASGAVSLVELGGTDPQSWSLNGDDAFAAGSTYKLPLLMDEAQALAAGTDRSSDSLCFSDQDWEEGPYGDYFDGDCISRVELMRRVGQNSDNTAAHLLVRYLGGGEALNEYASAHGARESGFYDPNLTTSSDLARLLADIAAGRAGGTDAQGVLYPLITHTDFEDGVPAGVPDGTTVVHKVGFVDAEVNDAALVLGGPQGDYVLTICTDGLGGDEAWRLLASISRTVWQYESTR